MIEPLDMSLSGRGSAGPFAPSSRAILRIRVSETDKDKRQKQRRILHVLDRILTVPATYSAVTPLIAMNASNCGSFQKSGSQKSLSNNFSDFKVTTLKSFSLFRSSRTTQRVQSCPSSRTEFGTWSYRKADDNHFILLDDIAGEEMNEKSVSKILDVLMLRLQTLRMSSSHPPTWLCVCVVLLLSCTSLSSAGITSHYMRRLAAAGDIPEDSPYFKVPDAYNAPQQVHITQGDYEGRAVIVSWVTKDEPGDSKVLYGKEPRSKYTTYVTGTAGTYSFYNYTSGFIHHAVITGLEFDTKYYYTLGSGDSAREFWFITPPESKLDTPYTFGVIGDLGQTYDSLSTLQHYMNSSGQALLYVGDLSYADTYPFDNNVRWDTWGRLVEPSTAYQPWIWTAGNHELDYIPEVGETIPFKPYTHRYLTPYEASNSTSTLWYSIKRGPATIIVLSSYSAYGKYTPQYKWLLEALAAVDRSVTPWLIVLVHSPWYNSNTYHYYEGETMRVIFEPFLTKYKVDIVFAGHVHAYERTHPVSNVKYDIVNGLCTPENNETAPIYVVIGDGGNVEGLAGKFTQPQPSYSAFREASFGHGVLEIYNHTHAYFTWHRNQDGEKVAADSTMLLNKYWYYSTSA